MGAVQTRVGSDPGDPLRHEPRVLAGRHTLPRPSHSEQEIVRSFTSGLYIVVDRLTSLLGQLKSDRTTSFLLAHGRSIDGVAVGCNVVDPDGDDVAAAQFAVGGEIEHCQVARLLLNLELGSDCRAFSP